MTRREHYDTREEVTIGVVGADQAVRRMMAVAHDAHVKSWRLVAAVCATEQQAYAKAMKISAQVDVCLFSGRMSYDAATGQGALPVPATYVSIDGSALHGTLLRSIIAGLLDPLRLSIDSVTAWEVQRAYEEIGSDPAAVHVLPYTRPGSAAEFTDFHRDLFERGATSGAITTVPHVAAALGKAGVPSVTMAPSTTTVGHALHAAGLMAQAAKLEESRIATMIVHVPRSALPGQASPSSYMYQERKLALYSALLRAAWPMDAAVLPRDENSYLVVTTMGSLAIATDGLTAAPFLARINNEVGVDVSLGIGLGRSTREAELNAQVAVGKSLSAAAGTAYLVGTDGTAVSLAADSSQPVEESAHRTEESKAAQTLNQLADRLESKDSAIVVDAEQVAESLEVTMQTARRTLKMLVNEGLAWPMPPARSAKVGRPPKLYQLLLDKVGQR
jgi:hypothetical protein